MSQPVLKFVLAVVEHDDRPAASRCVLNAVTGRGPNTYRLFGAPSSRTSRFIIQALWLCEREHMHVACSEQHCCYFSQNIARSPRKIFIVIINKYIFRIKVLLKKKIEKSFIIRTLWLCKRQHMHVACGE